MKTILKSVRPELVEGLSFYFCWFKEEGQASTMTKTDHPQMVLVFVISPNGLGKLYGK